MAPRIAALIVAVNPTLIEQARTVRMYPLTLVLELLQVVCFLRAVSTRARGAGRIASLAGIMVFSALAIASNFTAALLIAAEVMWLGWVAVRRRIAARACDIGELHLLATAAGAVRRDGAAGADGADDRPGIDRRRAGRRAQLVSSAAAVVAV